MSHFRRAFRIPRFTRRHVARDIDEELAFHVAQRAERLIAGGMPPESARAEAERRFGDATRVRADCMEIDTAEWREDALRMFLQQTAADLRLAVRSLRRAPGFTLTALTTLVLAVGLLGAIFSYFNAIYYAALPYRDANRIVALNQVDKSGRYEFSAVSLDAIRLIGRESRSFERLSAYRRTFPVMSSAGAPVQLGTLGVDTAFIPLFGLQPQLGRLLTSEEITARAEWR